MAFMRESVVSRPSAYRSGASERGTPAERRLAARLDARAQSGEVFIIDVTRATLTQNFTPDGPPDQAILYGRENAIYVPQSYGGQRRHPIIGAINDRRCLVFGAGGYAPNDLNQGLNGALRRLAVPGPGGVETNDLPLHKPGASRTFWGRIHVPLPGTSVAGVAWPSSGYVPGGTLIGSAGGNQSLCLAIDTNNGKLTLQNRRSVVNWAGVADLRDGNIHNFLCTFNAVTGVGTGYVDGAASGQPVTQPSDVVTTDGAARLVIAGFLDSSGSVADRFSGIVFGLGGCTGADGEDPAFRADVFAYLAGL